MESVRNYTRITPFISAPKDIHNYYYGKTCLRTQRTNDNIVFQYLPFPKEVGISNEKKLFDIQGMKVESVYDAFITKLLHEYVRISKVYLILDHDWFKILN